MQPYSFIAPTSSPNGILFNSPHSGQHLPQDFLEQISIDPSILHFSADFMIDQLIENVPDFGASIFANNIARTYVDTNRSANEIDQNMFVSSNCLDNVNYSDKVARGFGIFSSKSYNGQDIYQKKLPVSEISHRLNHYYHPIHARLSEILHNFYREKGFYFLIDCHSMPSYEFINPKISNEHQPDLVIGNFFDRSCRKKLTQFIADYFGKYGFKIAINRPYSGGYNTQYYGNNIKGCNAIQLEFNRAIYLNEKTLSPNSSFHELQKMITGLSQQLDKNAVDLQ